MSARFDDGEVDIAIFQLRSAAVRPTDIVLWSEQLVWATSVAETFVNSPIPLLDFGDHCYYNTFTHGILERAGIAYETIFSAASSVDVASAVHAGIGVGVLSDRYVTEGIEPWKPPVELEPLPQVSQVLRTVPGERPEAVAALVETIQGELTQGRTGAI